VRQSDLDWVARELLDTYCRARAKVIAIDEWLEHEPLVRPDGTPPDVLRIYFTALTSSVKTLDSLRSTIAEAARNDARFIDAVDALAAEEAR
jgi:hypothetical protein